MQNKIKKLLTTFPNQTQFAIAQTTPSITTHFGFKKANNKIQEIENAKHAFEIGSIAKVFTSYVLCQLAIEQKLNIQDPLSKYFPEIKIFQQHKVTLEQLANHSSGLPRLPANFYTVKDYDERDPYRYYYESDLLECLHQLETLEYEPGEKEEYSNLGPGLLSYTLSKIANKPFGKMAADRIFKPLQMDDTTYEIEEVKTKLVEGLDPKGKPVGNWNGGILNGCIGTISTATDMLQFAKAMFVENDLAIHLQMKKSISTAPNRYHGLGWGIREWKSGLTTHQHGGGSAGYISHLKINQRDKCGIVFLSNVSAFHERGAELESLCLDLAGFSDEPIS